MKNNLNKIISLVYLFTGSSFAQISSLHPHDTGIQNHPLVLFAEMFEQSSIPTMTSANWNAISSVTSNILFDASVPPGSLGTQSLRLKTIETGTTSNEPDEDTYIYKKLNSNINDSVFVRFYIKYDNATCFHHSGVWMGGKNPPSNTPGNQAGVAPLGNQAFHVGAEVRGAVNSGSVSTATFGFYNYWMNMHASSQTNTATSQPYYWGNEFFNSTSNDDLNTSNWNCIEVMVKLNNPVTAYNGELALWVNGIKISHYGYQFPNGTWNYSQFTEGAGTPFEGYQWRNSSALGFNYLWLKNYATNFNVMGHVGNTYIDHLVVAKGYIGPIALSTDLKESSEVKNTLKLFPNPTNQLLNFSEVVNGYEVYDMIGKKIMSQKLPSKNLSTENLVEGVYIIHANNMAIKFVVKH